MGNKSIGYCFSSTQRAGHKFWEMTNVKEEISDQQKTQLQNSLREIYRSCDESIGEILQLVPEETTVFVFSLHGMGENTTLADKILPMMISNVLSNKKNETES